MQDTALIVFGCVTALLAAILIGGIPLHYRREMKKARVQAEEQFRNYHSTRPDGSPLLVGATAQILDKTDSYNSHNGLVHDYVLTLFVLTPAGQHFVFKSNESGNPYVSPLAPERARLVLKDKYREAAARDA
jgi:hypothetical protein